jgi:hypothetical protein
MARHTVMKMVVNLATGIILRASTGMEKSASLVSGTTLSLASRGSCGIVAE